MMIDLEDANRQCDTVRIHVKAVTGIPKSRSNGIFGKSREYYVSVKVDNEIKETRMQRNVGSLEWDESLLLPARRSSIVKLRLLFRNRFQVKCVGEFQEKLTNLMTSTEPIISRPLTSSSKHRSEGSVQIIFAVEVQVDKTELIEVSILQANEDLQRLEHTAPLNTVNESDNLGSGMVDEAERITDPWKPFLRRVKLFVELVDKVAEVHPYAKMAWSVLSFAYKIVASQLERDRNVTDLVDAMNGAYAFMIEAKRAEEVLAQKEILEHLAQQTVDCAYFISSYSKDSSFVKRAGKHAITITADDAVAEYKAKFAEILEAFSRQAILQTEIATFGIVKGVSELAQDMDLMDMPYADGARYQRGKQCLAGTRVDILDDISKWITDMDDKRRICILTGAAGVGKSSIAHTLARRFEDIQRLGSSFCFSKDQANRTPDLLIPTLARDLAGHDLLVKKALSDIVHNRPSLRKTRDFEDQFDNILLKATACLSVTGPVFISIDALDESGDVQARRKLLSVFIRNVNKLPSNLKIFFTSRAENDILELFQDNSDIFFLSMVNSATSTDDDILKYIRAQLVDGRGRPLPGLDEIRQKILADKAEGLFQWASVACNVIIGDGRAGSNPLARYDKLLSSLGFSASPLDSLYEAVLSQVFDTKEEDTMRLFTEVMGLVLAAYEPLSIATLDGFWKRLGTETVRRNPDGIRSVLKYMGSLLSGIHTENEGVRPLHTSFRDFLTDPVRSGTFCIDISASHSRLYLVCLGVLNTNLRFNICHLESSYLRNSQIADLSVRIRRYVPTHLSYACRFWGNHLEEATSSDISSSDFVMASHQNLELFLQNCLLCWFEVLSLLNSVNLVHSSLSAVISHVKEKDVDLAAFAADAQKFIRMFGGLISECCPHIYLSALPCTPPTSRVYRRYRQFNLRSASIVKGAISGWPQLQNIIDNTSLVWSVAFSPDGNRIVSGSDDYMIRIWDAETGGALGAPLEGHTDSVESVAFSPNGNRIVSGSYDNTIRIWDAETGAALRALEGHIQSVLSVAFSPSGNRIVSGSADKTIRIWDADTGLVIGAPLEGHRDLVWSVVFSPDGNRIVSGSSDNTIMIWYADTGVAARIPLVGHTDSVRSVAFSPDGNYIVSGSDDKTILIWDADTGSILRVFEGHTTSVQSVAFSPDGNRVVSGSSDNTVRIWDAETGAAERTLLESHTDSVRSVSFSPDGNRIVSGSSDKSIRIWDADTSDAASASLEGHTSSIWSVAFSPDGNRVASGSSDKTIRVWDADTGLAVRAPLEGHTSFVLSVAFSPDGKRIASGSLDMTIRIWDVDTGTAMGAPLEGHTDSVLSVTFSPDGKRIVSGSSDKTVRIWDVDTGAAVGAPLEYHTSFVLSVAFSPDGNLIASGSDDKTVQIWDADTGLAVGAPLVGHTDSVLFVAFSQDGNRIVSSSDERTIRIWDTDTGAALGELDGCKGLVLSVAFSPDGTRIVSDFDNTIRIWDADTGGIMGAPLEGHINSVLFVAFSPDGKRIVSGSFDNTIRIWNAEVDDVQKEDYNSIASSPDQSSAVVRQSAGFQRIHHRGPSTVGQNEKSFDASECFITPKDSPSPLVLFSSTREHALPLGELSNRIDPTRTLGSITYNANSGWISGASDELLFYVPHPLRRGLIVPRNIAICGVQPVEIDFSQFVHGTSWSECYIPMSF